MSNTADSAGVPWAGRTLAPSPFAGDDGSASTATVAALEAYAAAEAADDRSDLLRAVGRAVLDHRVFAPVVARTTSSGAVKVTDAGIEIAPDKSADVSLVTMVAPDSRQAQPLFTSVATLRRWRADARPIPVDTRRALVATVDAGCEVVALDPGGPVTVWIPRPAVWAWAQGTVWVPFLHDDTARAQLAGELRAVPLVSRVAFQPGDGYELCCFVGVPPGLGQDDVAAVGAGVQHVLSTSDVVAERIDSVTVRFIADVSSSSS